MTRYSAFLAAFLFSAAASASTVEDALRLWSSQTGTWVGEIDIYGPTGTEPQTVGLQTRWSSTPDKKIPVKIETFSTPDRSFSSVTLMMADKSGQGIVTPYFANGAQKDYRFAVLEVTETDDTHWRIVIASPDGQEVYEDRPAVLRYVRTRTGNAIENTKEVNFLDDDGDDTYELRSFIRQSLVDTQ